MYCLCCSMYCLCCSMYCLCCYMYCLCCSMYCLCCSMYCLFCVVLCIVCVYMCTVLLPPVGYPIVVKYIISRLDDHTQTHPTGYDSSGRAIRSSQRPLPDNTQHSRQANIHVVRGIRTHNPSKRAAADPRLRTRDHRIGLS